MCALHLRRVSHTRFLRTTASKDDGNSDVADDPLSSSSVGKRSSTKDDGNWDAAYYVPLSSTSVGKKTPSSRDGGKRGAAKDPILSTSAGKMNKTTTSPRDAGKRDLAKDRVPSTSVSKKDKTTTSPMENDTLRLLYQPIKSAQRTNFLLKNKRWLWDFIKKPKVIDKRISFSFKCSTILIWNLFSSAQCRRKWDLAMCFKINNGNEGKGGPRVLPV